MIFKKIKYLFFIGLFILPNFSWSQINIDIYDTKIFGNSSLMVYFLVKNNSDSNIILPSLHNVNLITTNEDYFCFNQEDVGGGVIPFIYDKKNEQVGGISKSDGFSIHTDPQMAIEYYIKEIKMEMERQKNDVVMLRPNDTLRTEILLNLDEYDIIKGDNYQINLLYYCGEYIYKIVGEDILYSKQKNNAATLFQGCIKSNKISFAIKNEE